MAAGTLVEVDAGVLGHRLLLLETTEWARDRAGKNECRHLPNGARLSCGAKFEHTQTYDSFKKRRRQLQALVRQAASSWPDGAPQEAQAHQGASGRPRRSSSSPCGWTRTGCRHYPSRAIRLDPRGA